MTDHQFATIWADALADQSRDAWISDWALSSIWEDAPDAEIPADRAEQLGRIWDVAHMTVKEMVAKTGLSQAKFAERHCIPKRTVENWCSGTNKAPDYDRLFIARQMGLL